MGVRQAWGKRNNIWVFGGIFFRGDANEKYFCARDFGQRGTYGTNKFSHGFFRTHMISSMVCLHHFEHLLLGSNQRGDFFMCTSYFIIKFVFHCPFAFSLHFFFFIFFLVYDHDTKILDIFDIVLIHIHDYHGYLSLSI
jgi:hypothetical protein